VGREWAGQLEIIDIIRPLWQDDEKQGYLRTVISVKHLQNFSRNRKTILIIASMVAFVVIILTVFLTSRIYQSSIKDINVAIESLSESKFDYESRIKSNDEFSPVFSQIYKLHERTTVLSDSFQQSEDRIRAMMRVIHEGLLIMDGDMNIITYNEYLLDILHIKKHSNCERSIFQILQKNPRLLEIYRRTKDPMTHTARKVLSLKLLDEKVVNLQVNAMPISNHKNDNSIILYLKNLGVLQELERNLHRSMKYGVISQLASSVGHEIRNPLSSLAIHSGIVDSLVSKSVQDTQQLKKIKKSVGILNSEVERLSKMIDQFFNLARTQEISLNYENINNIMTEVRELVYQQALEKNITIHDNFHENLPMLYISRDQIKQVIINLILNAYDAMPDGGDLYLCTKLNERTVVITVKDTGKGIPAETRDHIFDLYFSTKTSGGGIGLAISRKIVEFHEGRIDFESESGNGTTFSIELPT
jgi:signal transduction histidine kinase